MRLVLQRVSKAKVEVDGKVVGEIGNGLLVLLGIAEGDSLEKLEWVVRKVAELRIFNDADQKMNLNLLEVGGEALVVSQFTLLADIEKGRRPSFVKAAAPEIAESMYLKFIEQLQGLGIKTETGEFGAKMSVSLLNEGPVTIILDR